MVGKVLCEGSEASQILGVMRQSVFVWALCRLWSCSKYLPALSFLILSSLCVQWALILHSFKDRVLPALGLSFARESFEDAAHSCCFSQRLLPAPSTTCFAVLVMLPQPRREERSSASLCPRRGTVPMPGEDKRRELSLDFFFFWDLE